MECYYCGKIDEEWVAVPLAYSSFLVPCCSACLASFLKKDKWRRRRPFILIVVWAVVLALLFINLVSLWGG